MKKLLSKILCGIAGVIIAFNIISPIEVNAEGIQKVNDPNSYHNDMEYFEGSGLTLKYKEVYEKEANYTLFNVKHLENIFLESSTHEAKGGETVTTVMPYKNIVNMYTNMTKGRSLNKTLVEPAGSSFPYELHDTNKYKALYHYVHASCSHEDGNGYNMSLYDGTLDFTIERGVGSTDVNLVSACFWDKENFNFIYYEFMWSREEGEKDTGTLAVYTSDTFYLPHFTSSDERAGWVSFGEFSAEVKTVRGPEWVLNKDGVYSENANFNRTVREIMGNCLKDATIALLDENIDFSVGVTDAKAIAAGTFIEKNFSIVGGQVYGTEDEGGAYTEYNDAYTLYANVGHFIFDKSRAGVVSDWTTYVSQRNIIGAPEMEHSYGHGPAQLVFFVETIIDGNGNNSITKYSFSDACKNYGYYRFVSTDIVWDLNGDGSLPSDPDLSNSIGTGMVKDYCDSLISYYAKNVYKNVQAVDQMTESTSYVNNIPCSTIANFLSNYEQELLKEISDLKLTEKTNEVKDMLSKKTFEGTTAFEVLTAICELNIATMTKADPELKWVADYFTMDKWDTKAVVYFPGDGNTEQKGSHLDKYKDFTDKTVYSINELYGTKLTDLEKQQLSFMYQNAKLLYSTYAADKNTGHLFGSPIEQSFEYPKTGLDVSYKGLSVLDHIVNSTEDIKATADGTILSYLKYTNTAGLYNLYYNLYGAVDGEADIDSIFEFYNESLETVTKKRYAYNSNEFYFPSKLISTTNKESNFNKLIPWIFCGPIKYSEDNDSAGNSYNLRFANHLFNVAYGFEIINGNSKTAKNELYSAAAIDKALGGTNPSIYHSGDIEDITTSFNFNPQSKFESDSFGAEEAAVLRTIVELYDFCDFLGIEENDWTEDIGDYLRLYKNHTEVFERVRENPYIFQAFAQGEVTPEEPLGEFFSLSEATLSDQWVKGFALSSTYSPMNTNLYDSSAVGFIEDVEWVSEFYYKYGFYRKALYINTDSSAIVNKFITGQSSGTKVATLGDLLQYDRDIILTIDDNFYNAKDVEGIISKLDYASVEASNVKTSDETGAAIKQFLGINTLYDLEAGSLLKTGDHKYYNSNVWGQTSKLGEDEETSYKTMDSYLLTKEDILEALGQQEYSVMQPMAVVSSVYKSQELYNYALKTISVDNAVFKSSKAIVNTPGTQESDWLALYNYYMLANLEDQMKNDSASTLDLDAPIFIDIFGNIVTESGLVIIPAASNATLCGAEWTPMSVGWADLYYNGEMIVADEMPTNVLEWLLGVKLKENEDGTREVMSSASKTVDRTCGGGWLSIDGDKLQIRTSEVHSAGNSAVIQWSNLSKNSDRIKQIFYNYGYYEVGTTMFNYTTVNNIMEVLRGAPIEHIDYNYEGLDKTIAANKYGVAVAYAAEHIYDVVLNSINGDTQVGNGMTSLPNLAFMEGVEYIVVFAFKIAFALGIAALAIHLYLEAMENRLGIKSVGVFLYTLILVILAVTVVPQVLSWSYYRSNKALLTEDILYIAMLDYQKEFDGSEINITDISTPETTTELYLKLDDISLDWWSVLYEVIFQNSLKTVEELYENQLTDNSYIGQPGVEIKADGVYLSVKELYNSTAITYLPASNTLVNYTYEQNDTLVGSYASPYYYFLDQLIANINAYNIKQDVEAYTYSIAQNGHICTYELTSAYFKSNEFMETGYDLLNLHWLYKTGVGTPNPTIVDVDDINIMEYSLWWPTEKDLADEEFYAKIDNFYNYARDYIANNADIIGKVPDEVFIKTFALHLAVEWNNMFRVPVADSIEIMNVDTRDLMRLMAGSKADVYKYNAYGLARFVYEVGGAFGCIMSCLFAGLVWISNLLKTVIMVVIMGLLAINVIFRRTIYKSRGSLCIQGYLVTCGFLAAINLLYSLLLKLSITVSEYGMNTTSSFLFGTVVQILYLTALVSILMITVKDWQNNGMAEWQNISAAVTHGGREAMHSIRGFFHGNNGDGRRVTTPGVNSLTSDEMMRRQEEYESGMDFLV